jgi:dTDP-4-dehydrorhamnose reductase
MIEGFCVRPIDLTDRARVTRELTGVTPDVIIHAAAISTADSVRRDPERARLVNVEGTQHLVEWVAHNPGSRLVYTSTDLVFDGSRAWSTEETAANPVVEYGRTKLAAEAAVLSLPRGLVARLSLLYGFGSPRRPGFWDKSIETLRRGESCAFFSDEFRTPLDYHSAAEILVQLAESSATGLVHVAGAERMSRYELMTRSAVALGIDPDLVTSNPRANAMLTEPRPADVSLSSARLRALLPQLVVPTVEQAVATLSQ